MSISIMDERITSYVHSRQASPRCSNYLDGLHRFAMIGMDQRGLLCPAGSKDDATDGRLYTCFCGAARIGPDPDEANIPHPPEDVIDPRRR